MHSTVECEAGIPADSVITASALLSRLLWTSHFSTKLDVKMSNYFACSDHGAPAPLRVAF